MKYLIIALVLLTACQNTNRITTQEQLNKHSLRVLGTTIPEFPTEEIDHWIYFSDTVDSVRVKIVFTEDFAPQVAFPITLNDEVVDALINEEYGKQIPIKLQNGEGLYFFILTVYGLDTERTFKFKYEIL